jgi:hypothetical protein
MKMSVVDNIGPCETRNKFLDLFCAHAKYFFYSESSKLYLNRKEEKRLKNIYLKIRLFVLFGSLTLRVAVRV